MALYILPCIVSCVLTASTHVDSHLYQDRNAERLKWQIATLLLIKVLQHAPIKYVINPHFGRARQLHCI